MKGFTILELMITIVVAAILTMVAVPSFRTAIQRHRIQAASDDLQASIQYARTEAVLRATYVSLCASTDGASCAGISTYETGWIVYAHAVATSKSSDTYTASSTGAMQLLRASPALNQVAARGLDANVVTFGQQGQLETVASRTNASQPMAFAVCGLASAKATAGANTTLVPGYRLGLSRYGGIAVTKLAATDTCQP